MNPQAKLSDLIEALDMESGIRGRSRNLEFPLPGIAFMLEIR